MHTFGRLWAVAGTIAAGLAIAACGSSSTSSSSTSSSSTSPGSSSSSASISASGGSFCAQVVSATSEYAQLGSKFAASAGGTPDIASLQQSFSALASLFDQLDSNPPSQIQASVHTLRTAFDSAAGAVKNASSYQDLASAFAGFNGQAVASASANLGAYVASSCAGVSATTT